MPGTPPGMKAMNIASWNQNRLMPKNPPNPSQTPVIDALAPVFTLVKWFFVNGSFVILVFGVVLLVWSACESKAWQVTVATRRAASGLGDIIQSHSQIDSVHAPVLL